MHVPAIDLIFIKSKNLLNQSANYYLLFRFFFNILKLLETIKFYVSMCIYIYTHIYGKYVRIKI